MGAFVDDLKLFAWILLKLGVLLFILSWQVPHADFVYAAF